MALNKKVFKIPKNDKDEVGIAIVDTPCSAEGLVLTTWSSAGILSHLLHKLNFDLPQSHQNNAYTILELGAGTGLSGLAAACVWGTTALLTDLPTIVPGVQANVDLNTAVLKAHGASATCGTLDWKHPDIIHVYSADDGPQNSFTVDDVDGFPVILTADTMYTEEHPQLVSQTIMRCLRRSSEARAVVVYAMRVAYIDHMREFWELMEAGGLVPVQEGREEIDLKDWDDEKLHEWSVWKWKDL